MKPRIIRYIFYAIGYIVYLICLLIESFIYTMALWAIMALTHINLLTFPQLIIFVFICGVLFNMDDLILLIDDIDENL
jgi:hypothetical protein